jgi:phospholipid/cholesterol/gamma-HCH transport system substrate-binding protein
MLLAGVALLILALKVSGLTSLFPAKSYTVTAAFDDIGGLKVRAPVKISGVQIGEISEIKLDPETFKAMVSMRIRDQFNDIPDDSSAGIYTAGLLGDNYISITPMYSKTFLANGGTISYTHPAMILEKLIGQFMYRISNSNSNSPQTQGDTHEQASN